jgi:hypothetical protein
VEVTRLGLGSAEVGGLYTAVPDAQAGVLLAHAWERGVPAALWAELRHEGGDEGGRAA